MAGPNVVVRARMGLGRRWKRAKARHRWLEHLVVAYQRFTENNGNQYAAAITYFSFLAIFPLVLLGVAIAGFVLNSHPDLLKDLSDNITASLPGDFGKKLKDSINTAIANRTSVGLVGLLGVLITGLGWIGNLRAAYNAVWGVELPKRNAVKKKLSDLLVLIGLGIGAVVSIGITIVGTALSGRVLSALSLDTVPGAQLLAGVASLAIAIVADVLIFAWLLVKLPATEVRFGMVVRGAILAAVGFEVLKVVGTYYIARVNSSPTAGVFGSVIGILVFIDLVSRYQLFCAAWTATGIESVEAPAAALDRGEPPVPADLPTRTPGPQIISPVSVATSLVGAGAALGGAAVAWLASRRRRRG
ncbi:MAG: inner membrane protein YhjD [Actinomycetota bacterium]